MSFFKSNSLNSETLKMSETKSKSKSKNRNRQVKTDPYDLQRAPTDTNNNTISKYSVSSPGPSLLEKLDLEHLRQISFSAIKPSAVAGAQPRDAYIDYALDMVINNLIVNGHLDPTKASQIRTPLMKSQIASMCEKMVTVKGNKEMTKKKLSEMSRSKPKVQKWAVQPTSLPITIITNQIPSGSGLVDLDSVKKSESSKVSGEFITGEKPKKIKSKKSKKTASVCIPPPDVLSKLGSLNNNNAYRPDRPSSEVPSSNSLEKNMNQISSNTILENSDKKDQKNVHFLGSELFKNENNQPEVAQAKACTSSSNKDGQSRGTTATVMMPLFQPPPSNESRLQSPGLSSCTSSTKTLNTYISSRSSLVSTKGFQILVDMKEFNNEEISMEVEDRKLIFLGSRPKRNGLNVRKVTEIVEVPKAVVMENLKIGRRVDGYVIVEEHDNDE